MFNQNYLLSFKVILLIYYTYQQQLFQNTLISINIKYLYSTMIGFSFVTAILSIFHELLVK